MAGNDNPFGFGPGEFDDLARDDVGDQRGFPGTVGTYEGHPLGSVDAQTVVDDDLGGQHGARRSTNETPTLAKGR